MWWDGPIGPSGSLGTTKSMYGLVWVEVAAYRQAQHDNDINSAVPT